MRDQLTDVLRSTLVDLGVPAPDEIHLERPARREHGDFSSNVALTTAKSAGRNPRELAGDIVTRLMADLLIEKLGGQSFSWGGGALMDEGEMRSRYVVALRAADEHDIAPLLMFARS